MRAAARTLAYRSGALGLRRPRRALTVAMFHRVVVPGTPAAARADPVYALPDGLFADCLRFFRRHYHVVGLADVLASRAGGPPLPPRALLLTFDDGWADTLDVAAPLLRRARLPALVFVASDALGDPSPWWWQEVALRAFAHAEPYALLQHYASLDPASRAAALAPFADAAEGRHMLRQDQLAAVTDAGIAIGAHGASHLPLTLLADPAADLAACRAVLGDVETFSFPHGRYDAASLAAARDAGFQTIFTSDACLNAAPDGRPADLLGRISIEAGAITGPGGRLDPARLATWLWRRPVRRLAP